MSQWSSAKAKKVLAALEKIGWTVKHQTGSHKIIERDGWDDYVFTFADNDLIESTKLIDIAKKTGLKPEDVKRAEIYYARMDEFWRKEQKLSSLEKVESLQDVDWQKIEPNTKYVWLTEGFEDDFDSFIALGSKEAKASKIDVTDCIFKIFSNGVKTNRDLWVYSFTSNDLSANIKTTVEAYNIQVSRWNQQESKSLNIDDFIIYDDTKISWSSTLKTWLKRGDLHKFNSDQIRSA